MGVPVLCEPIEAVNVTKTPRPGCNRPRLIKLVESVLVLTWPMEGSNPTTRAVKTASKEEECRTLDQSFYRRLQERPIRSGVGMTSFCTNNLLRIEPFLISRIGVLGFCPIVILSRRLSDAVLGYITCLVVSVDLCPHRPLNGRHIVST